MAKKVKRLIGAWVALILLISSFGMQALAASPMQTESNVVVLDADIFECVNDSGISAYATIFDKATITISYHSDSGMQVLILTYVNGVASVVGVKDILIQAKSGSNWVTVATSAGGELTNVQGMGCEVTYAGAVEGVTYRVVCTHYADYEGYRELYHESEGLECKY